jgi:hypothetical protein
MRVSRVVRFSLVAVMTAAAGSWAGAAQFVAPTETPSTFHRHQIPLDAEMISRLSAHLTQAVKGIDPKSPAELRSAAQILALAVALDPGNPSVREILSDFKKNRHQPSLSDAGRETILRDVNSVLEGLASPEAGEMGHALANYLADVIRYIRPGSQTDTPELGNWAGWAPELSDYEEKANPEMVQEKPKTVITAPQKFLLEKAEVMTPIWWMSTEGENSKRVLELKKLKMLTENPVGEANEPQPFKISGRGPAQSLNSPFSQAIFTQLLNLEGIKIPKDGDIIIGSELEEAKLSSGTPTSINAAAAVLASAALTGRVPDAIIMGAVDAKGAFTIPKDFWDQLRCLPPGKGARLVLPTAAATAYLPAMLALENAQFFFDYEVVLAANFHELLELSAKEPDASLAQASGIFLQIREKLGTQVIGPYLANPFVRRRLAEITPLAPCHASAKMLGIQGAGNRPAHLSREIFANEMQQALEPLDWLLSRAEPILDVKEYATILESYEACHKKTEILSRYADRGEEDLMAKYKELLSQVKSLERTTRSRAAEYDAYVAMNIAHVTMIRSSIALRALLKAARTAEVGK